MAERRRLVDGLAEGGPLLVVAAQREGAARLDEEATEFGLAARPDLCPVEGGGDAVVVVQAVEVRRRVGVAAAGRREVVAVAHLEEACPGQQIDLPRLAAREGQDEIRLLAEPLDARIAHETAGQQAALRVGAGDEPAGLLARRGVYIGQREQLGAVRIDGLEVRRIPLQEERPPLDAELARTVHPVGRDPATDEAVLVPGLEPLIPIQDARVGLAEYPLRGGRTRREDGGDAPLADPPGEVFARDPQSRGGSLGLGHQHRLGLEPRHREERGERQDDERKAHPSSSLANWRERIRRRQGLNRPYRRDRSRPFRGECRTCRV